MRTKDFFIYSSDYHKNQIKHIHSSNSLIMLRVGFKHQPIIRRIFEFLKCFILVYLNKQSTIHIPRSAALDNLVLYKAFRTRSNLISDGLSDLITPLTTTFLGKEVGFFEKINKNPLINLSNLEKRNYIFSKSSCIAVFNKRGRDPDYVSEFVRKQIQTDFIVNPTFGEFSKFYSAPSTVLFEIPDCLKKHVFIVSCKHSKTISRKRMRVLMSYELALQEIGYSII